jgi:secondary thiamine-phosphate synthase enzyme
VQQTIQTKSRVDTIDITEDVNDALTVDHGACHITTQHTTCGLTVNEAHDPRLADDIHDALNDIAPRDKDYAHDRVDGNADAHIKASLIGHDVTLTVRNNDLVLGRWQRILLFEFDGSRQRTITITCTLGEQ